MAAATESIRRSSAGRRTAPARPRLRRFAIAAQCAKPAVARPLGIATRGGVYRGPARRSRARPARGGRQRLGSPSGWAGAGSSTRPMRRGWRAGQAAAPRARLSASRGRSPSPAPVPSDRRAAAVAREGRPNRPEAGSKTTATMEVAARRRKIAGRPAETRSFGEPRSGRWRAGRFPPQQMSGESVPSRPRRARRPGARLRSPFRRAVGAGSAPFCRIASSGCASSCRNGAAGHASRFRARIGHRLDLGDGPSTGFTGFGWPGSGRRGAGGDLRGGDRAAAVHCMRRIRKV